MKATGIVRRVDELGRVVIPKEIRKTLRISSGDPMEIFTEQDKILLKKYSPIKSLDGSAKKFADSLAEMSGKTAAVCDTDVVVACAGDRDLADLRVSKELEKVMRDRHVLVINASEGGACIKMTQDGDGPCFSQVIAPIVIEGDCMGACILYSSVENDDMKEIDVKLAKMAADLLSRQLAE